MPGSYRLFHTVCHAKLLAEMGNPFMARQSYLPTEIKWGHQFVPIIRKPKPPSTRYLIEIEK